MLPYLLIELFYIGMPIVRTDSGRAYGYATTKISQMGRLRHFLTYRATLERAMRALGASLELSIMRFDVLDTTRRVRKCSGHVGRSETTLSLWSIHFSNYS